MKKLLALLLAMMLLTPVVLAEVPVLHYLTTPDGLILTYYTGPSGAISTSETFVQGLYIEKKWEEAYDLNLLLAAAGDTNAMVRLGDQHLNGLGVPEDAAAANTWYQRAAETGNADAQFSLALMYLNGWGVEADATYAVGLLTECTYVSPRNIACLYLLGHGNLAPDMDKAMDWFDRSVPHERHMAQCDSANASFYQELYEQSREAFLATDTLPNVLTSRPSPTLWADGAAHASDAMDMGYFWHDGDGGVMDHIEAARWFEMAIEMDGNLTFVSEWSHAELGDYYRDGSLGAIDVDSAIRHYGHAASYSNIAAMFRSGVTGPDGTVYLTPDETLADAFTAVDEYREGTRAHFILLGDLFRTGSSPDGYAIITPDPYLAATFYFQGYNDPHCAAQLTAMYKDGLITDPMLLYLIARDIPWSEYDVSELILLLADDLIHERVEPWLPNNAANIYWNGVSTPVTLGVDLLEKALEKGKLPDPQAAYDLLALVPSNE